MIIKQVFRELFNFFWMNLKMVLLKWQRVKDSFWSNN